MALNEGGVMITPAPLLLTEARVRNLLNMHDALGALEGVFALPHGESADRKTNLPRQRAHLPAGFFNVMAASIPEWEVFGLKAYYRSGGFGGYHVLLYSQSEGRLLAVIESDYMSQLRTGAASGLAAKYMARHDAKRMAVIGTGKQAFWQVAAVAAVRSLSTVSVYGRTPQKAATLARRIEDDLEIEAICTPSLELCVRNADIVATITASDQPVCRSDWVDQGTHLNVAGSNTPVRQELDTGLMLRADALATDDIAQARLEAAEFLALEAQGKLDWTGVLTLDELCSGIPGRKGLQDITIFKSLGVAIEDVAIAARCYTRATHGTSGAGQGEHICEDTNWS